MLIQTIKVLLALFNKQISRLASYTSSELGDHLGENISENYITHISTRAEDNEILIHSSSYY